MASINRTRSGRDPKKTQAQGESLRAGQPTPRQRQSFKLVVCGATNHKDGFIFSDFMGFCMDLKEHGVGGEFYSCFPMEKHFIFLGNEKTVNSRHQIWEVRSRQVKSSLHLLKTCLSQLWILVNTSCCAWTSTEGRELDPWKETTGGNWRCRQHYSRRAWRPQWMLLYRRPTSSSIHLSRPNRWFQRGRSGQRYFRSLLLCKVHRCYQDL